MNPPVLPFPNLEIVTQGNVAIVKLKNDQLAEMLRKAIEQQGQQVKSVEVYPDSFVVTMDFGDIFDKLRQMGLNARLEPSEVKLVIERDSVVEAFRKVSGLESKGIAITDKKDYIELRGQITGIPISKP